MLRPTGIIAGLLVLFAGMATVNGIEINWHVFASGGNSQDGESIELVGSIGQPAADVMKGQGLAITSGFWTGTPTVLPLGDVDNDGDIDEVELAEFASCLGSMPGNAGADCVVADWNQDGAVDLADFAHLQVEFTGNLP